jgi:probable rRNA maturation factor
MTHRVDVAAEGVRVPVSRACMADAVRLVLRAERVPDAEVSIALVTDARIATLNRRHLAHRGATDVISFGMGRTVAGEPLVGDIYIAPGVAARSARERGIPVREELLRLVVHGTLHVIGHDHPDGEERVHSPMWKRQEQLLRRVLRGAAR